MAYSLSVKFSVNFLHTLYIIKFSFLNMLVMFFKKNKKDKNEP